MVSGLLTKSKRLIRMRFLHGEFFENRPKPPSKNSNRRQSKWYVSSMYEEWIQASENTVRYAQLVRNHHAKRLKRSNPQRQQDIDAALKRIASTMQPIRSYLGRMPGLAQDHPIRKASFALQRERRKLWKMQDRN